MQGELIAKETIKKNIEKLNLAAKCVPGVTKFHQQVVLLFLNAFGIKLSACESKNSMS